MLCVFRETAIKPLETRSDAQLPQDIPKFEKAEQDLAPFISCPELCAKLHAIAEIRRHVGSIRRMVTYVRRQDAIMVKVWYRHSSLF
jgi:hypothetical protein